MREIFRWLGLGPKQESPVKAVISSPVQEHRETMVVSEGKRKVYKPLGPDQTIFNPFGDRERSQLQALVKIPGVLRGSRTRVFETENRYLEVIKF